MGRGSPQDPGVDIVPTLPRKRVAGKTIARCCSSYETLVCFFFYSRSFKFAFISIQEVLSLLLFLFKKF